MERKTTSATSVILRRLRQAIWGYIWKYTVEKSWVNATNVIMHSRGRIIWRHIWKHTMESNKCEKCNFASYDVSGLRVHLRTHSGVKSHKCNQCDHVSSRAGHLRTHLKTLWRKLKPMWLCSLWGRRVEETHSKTNSQTSVINLVLHHMMQVDYVYIREYTVE